MLGWRRDYLRSENEFFNGIGPNLPVAERSCRRAIAAAPCRGALGAALSATSASAALGYYEIVGSEFVAIPTAGRG